jgi:hypothetical protein
VVVYYVAHEAHLYTIRGHLRTPGRGRSLIPLSYERLCRRMTREFWWTLARQAYGQWRRSSLFTPEARLAARRMLQGLARCVRAPRRLPPSAYIFSDIERLSPETADRAAFLWRSLAGHAGTRLLNHPTRSMRRYELLRTLYERGINAFNVYRLSEARWPERYPVFLRRENDHKGPLSPLLASRDELERAVARLDQDGVSRDNLLMSEFCDTSDQRGLYRKYGAFLVGDRVFVRSVQFSRNWVQKHQDLDEPELVREERAYVEANPHREAIHEVFRLARIDYGRMDYGVLHGKIQVWEINTNPAIAGSPASRHGPRHWIQDHAHRQLSEALQQLARGAWPTGDAGPSAAPDTGPVSNRS